MVTESIAVIIPTWNRAGTIERAIASVLGQSVAVETILVCDDGSTDESEEIVHRIASLDERVKWLRGKHVGRPAVPRNRGLKEVASTWVAFLDSDDWWEPNKLETQFNLMRDKSLDAACGNAARICNGVSQGNLLSIEHDEIGFHDLLAVNSVVCSSVVAKTSIVKACGYFSEEKELRAIEDYALWLRVSTFTRFAYCKEPIVDYRDDPVSSVRAQDKNVWWQRATVFSNCIHWLLKKKPRTADSAMYVAELRRRVREANWMRFQAVFGRYKSVLRRMIFR